MAALWAGADPVLEYYEYDAYGDVTIHTGKGVDSTWLTADDVISDESGISVENPYFFTGRRQDLLDEGSLEIQYSRNRYYDYYTGRWFTEDPLSTSQSGNVVSMCIARTQYSDGCNLYEYVKSMPTVSNDPFWEIEIAVLPTKWQKF